MQVRAARRGLLDDDRVGGEPRGERREDVRRRAAAPRLEPAAVAPCRRRAPASGRALARRAGPRRAPARSRRGRRARRGRRGLWWASSASSVTSATRRARLDQRRRARRGTAGTPARRRRARGRAPASAARSRARPAGRCPAKQRVVLREPGAGGERLLPHRARPAARPGRPARPRSPGCRRRRPPPAPGRSRAATQRGQLVDAAGVGGDAAAQQPGRGGDAARRRRGRPSRRWARRPAPGPRPVAGLVPGPGHARRARPAGARGLVRPHRVAAGEARRGRRRGTGGRRGGGGPAGRPAPRAAPG